jgi:hypothetical protein
MNTLDLHLNRLAGSYVIWQEHRFSDKIFPMFKVSDYLSEEKGEIVGFFRGVFMERRI